MKNAELNFIFLRPLTLLNYLCVICPSRFLSLSFSASLSFTVLASVQEWLSVAMSNRRRQIHNMPSALSQARGEQLLIFQRTLHYHSGPNTPGINTEALGCHARHLRLLPPHCITSSALFPKVRKPCNYRVITLTGTKRAQNSFLIMICFTL